jgi:hypothetical protein
MFFVPVLSKAIFVPYYCIYDIIALFAVKYKFFMQRLNAVSVPKCHTFSGKCHTFILQKVPVGNVPAWNRA